MQNNPLVSIILPTYNRAHLLPQAIKSVLEQDYPDWELIIWDDGSTDNTHVVIDSFQDDRIRYYYSENHGAAYARNRAVEKSTGNLLTFLDSDDEWKPGKLSFQVETLSSHPQIEILFTNFGNIREGEDQIHHTFEEYQKAINLAKCEEIGEGIYIIREGILNSISSDNYIALDSVMLQREVFTQAGGFNESLRNSEDFEFWWRLALQDRCFAFINKELLVRHKPSGSLSSFSEAGLQSHIKALDICVQDGRGTNHPEYSQYLRSQYRNAWQLLMACYGEKGDFTFMYSAFRRSLAYGFRLGTLRLLLSSIIRIWCRKIKGHFSR